MNGHQRDKLRYETRRLSEKLGDLRYLRVSKTQPVHKTPKSAQLATYNLASWGVSSAQQNIKARRSWYTGRLCFNEGALLV
jgi:hypothetical protein